MVEWNYLTTTLEFDDAISHSNKPENITCIFKHSTRCSVSRMVLKQFEYESDAIVNAKFYFVDLLNHRNISELISSSVQVKHDSPQIIVIKNGQVIHTSSHNNICFKNLVSHKLSS